MVKDANCFKGKEGNNKREKAKEKGRKRGRGREKGRKDGKKEERKKAEKKIQQGIEKERVSQVLSKAPCVSFINLTAN